MRIELSFGYLLTLGDNVDRNFNNGLSGSDTGLQQTLDVLAQLGRSVQTGRVWKIGFTFRKDEAGH